MKTTKINIIPNQHPYPQAIGKPASSLLRPQKLEPWKVPTYAVSKPMLAGKAPDELNNIAYPVLCTPKIDGIRCLMVKGKAVTRSFAPIPNREIAGVVEAIAGDGCDGELVALDENKNILSFAETSSLIMANRASLVEWAYLMFDYVTIPHQYYADRMYDLEKARLSWVWRFPEPLKGALQYGRHFAIVSPSWCATKEELIAYERECLARGFEGVMIRSQTGSYKEGRSTTAEGGLLKLKRFAQSEAIVIGIVEQQHNTNAKVKNAAGRSIRSTSADGLEGNDTLGALHCRDLETGEDFAVSGFTADFAASVWKNRGASLIGKIITYSHQPFGAAGKPRFPKFVGVRSPLDM